MFWRKLCESFATCSRTRGSYRTGLDFNWFHTVCLYALFPLWWRTHASNSSGLCYITLIVSPCLQCPVFNLNMFFCCHVGAGKASHSHTGYRTRVLNVRIIRHIHDCPPLEVNTIMLLPMYVVIGLQHEQNLMKLAESNSECLCTTHRPAGVSNSGTKQDQN